MSLGLNRRQFALASAAVLAVGPAVAMRYEDQDFADSISLGGSTLLLNGVGKRAVLTFRGYVAGLYMTARATTPEAVLAVPGPKRFEMRVLLDVGADELIKAVTKGVNRNCTEEEKAALGDRLVQLNHNFELVGKVRKKDLITVDFLPERGTVLNVNGKHWGQDVPGADLYRAFLLVFLGKTVSDKKLKAGLLGEAT